MDGESGEQKDGLRLRGEIGSRSEAGCWFQRRCELN